MTEHEAPPPPQEPAPSEEPVPSETAVQEPPTRPPFGRIALGILLLLIGFAWLLEVLDVVSVRWGALLPAALIVVGLVLVVAARTGGHGGLVALGIVLTVIVTVSGTLRVPLVGGIGERVERPTTAAQVSARYQLAMGKLEVDLSALPTTGSFPSVEASVGLGELIVRVPPEVGVRVTARAGAGEVVVFDETANGFGVDRTVTRAGTGLLQLEVSVGAGSIKVQEGG